MASRIVVILVFVFVIVIGVTFLAPNVVAIFVFFLFKVFSLAVFAVALRCVANSVPLAVSVFAFTPTAPWVPEAVLCKSK